jgi:hypothetical protein
MAVGGGAVVSDKERIAELEAENARLRNLLVEASQCVSSNVMIDQIAAAIAAPPGEPEHADADALTGCSDDQRFSDAEVNVIKRYLAQKSEALAEPGDPEDADAEIRAAKALQIAYERLVCISQAILREIDRFESTGFIDPKALRAALGAKP